MALSGKTCNAEWILRWGRLHPHLAEGTVRKNMLRGVNPPLRKAPTPHLAKGTLWRNKSRGVTPFIVTGWRRSWTRTGTRARWVERSASSLSAMWRSSSLCHKNMQQNIQHHHQWWQCRPLYMRSEHTVNIRCFSEQQWRHPVTDLRVKVTDIPFLTCPNQNRFLRLHTCMVDRMWLRPQLIMYVQKAYSQEIISTNLRSEFSCTYESINV